jgi:hypothetical protein
MIINLWFKNYYGMVLKKEGIDDRRHLKKLLGFP